MKTFFLFILLVVNLTFSNAQNNIGIGTHTPHASALLDVSSTTKGIMAPRMSTTERNAITSPAKGLLVYDTNLNALYHYNGAAWAAVGGGFSLPFEANVNLIGPTFQIQNSGSGDVLFLGASTGSAISAYNTGNSAAISVNAINGFGVYAQSFNSIPVLALSTNANNTLPAMRANNTGGGAGFEALSATQSAIKASSNNQFATIDAANPHVSGIGVLGTSISGIGIKGTSGGTGLTKAGVMGESSGNGSVGVLGSSVSATGFGVYGVNSTGVGVYGFSVNGTGMRGVSNSGLALEVVGRLKISGGNTNPSNGAVLTSDASGNAVWKANRVAFGVSGVNVNYDIVPHDAARRVQFQSPDLYDLTQSYTPLVGNNSYNPATSSTYAIPVTGIYHFDVGVHLSNFSFNNSLELIEFYGTMELKLNRNGNISTISRNIVGQKGIKSSTSEMSFTISRDFSLNVGDRIYVEISQLNNDERDFRILGENSFFTGHLVTPL